MPGARAHDIITVVSGAALGALAYGPLAAAAPESAAGATATLVGAHLLSGIMFSPDLDLDSQIDDRWGIFFWIWRPYMWLVPHRHFWSHGLILPPLLRLGYLYAMISLLVLALAWLLGLVGITVPDYHVRLAAAVGRFASEHPSELQMFVLGFVTGGAAHTAADWLVTGGKRYLRRLGIRVTRDYSDHDRYVPRQRRRAARQLW